MAFTLPFRFGTGTPINNQFCQQVDADFVAVAASLGGATIQPSGDVTGVADSTSINNALTAASSSGTRYVTLAAGQWYINSSILMQYPNVSLVGIGFLTTNTATVINSLVNGPAILVKATGSLVQGWGIENIQIQTPASGTSATGITVDSSQYGVIHNVGIQVNGASQTALFFNPSTTGVGAVNTNVDGLVIILGSSASAQALYLSANNNLAGPGLIGNTNANIFTNIEILLGANTQTAIHLGLCDTNTFINIFVFGGGSTAPTVINFDYGDRGAANTQWPNDNCFFQADLGFGIDWSSPASRIINSGSPNVYGSPNSFHNFDTGDAAVEVQLANLEYHGQRSVLVGNQGKIGYTIGAGNTVSQTVSITSTVILNNICGQITTVSHAWTSGTPASFGVTNSTVASTDTIIVNVQSVGGGGSGNQYLSTIVAVGTGAFQLGILPFITETSTLVINFSVIKAVNA